MGPWPRYQRFHLHRWNVKDIIHIFSRIGKGDVAIGAIARNADLIRGRLAIHRAYSAIAKKFGRDIGIPSIGHTQIQLSKYSNAGHVV
jgi:hypothetical protein